MKLVLPSVKYQKSYLEALREAKGETGPTVLARPEANQSFEQFVKNKIEESKGLHLPEGFVPATELWLVDKDEFIGRVSIRHQLTEHLLKIGGHIGYYIRPSKRKMGYGKMILNVFFTEFVPVDALLSQGHEKILGSLKFTESERPIVAQIWGSDPEKFYKAAKMLRKMKFDGIDINMGCPDKNAVKKGACAALIKNPDLAKEITNATIKGANGLPVSVKTRIGFREIDTENWVSALLQTPISALILHLRTVPEMSKVTAHWEEIGKALAIRNKLKSKALIIGNGDIKSLKEAQEKCKKYGIDGVMIGRGIFENIWLFNNDIKKATPQQKMDLLISHLELFKKTWGDDKHFELMKKFVKCYVNNFNGAVDVREKLMKTRSLDELVYTTRGIKNSFQYLFSGWFFNS